MNTFVSLLSASSNSVSHDSCRHLFCLSHQWIKDEITQPSRPGSGPCFQALLSFFLYQCFLKNESRCCDFTSLNPPITGQKMPIPVMCALFSGPSFSESTLSEHTVPSLFYYLASSAPFSLLLSDCWQDSLFCGAFCTPLSDSTSSSVCDNLNLL